MNYTIRMVFARKSQYSAMPENLFAIRGGYPVNYVMGTLATCIPCKTPVGMIKSSDNRVEAPYPKSMMMIEKNEMELLVAAIA